jgi:hypothetical protein
MTSVWSICQKFASLPLNLAGASIAEIAERLGLRYGLAIDQDFDIYRDTPGTSPAKSIALIYERIIFEKTPLWLPPVC